MDSSSFNLLTIRNRQEMVRFFDGYKADVDGSEEARIQNRPLVKTFLIENVIPEGASPEQALQSSFAGSHVRLKQVDDGLHLFSRRSHQIGFLERVTPRLVALYSVMDASKLKYQVEVTVRDNSQLDHVWFSGIAFNVLWNIVSKISEPLRYTRLVFSHESLYDVADSKLPIDRELTPESKKNRDVAGIVERRIAGFRLADRINIVKERLGKLQELYEPLYAISQLRIPSPASRGGHDVYSNGQVTNRSESFLDHRSHVQYLARIYDRALSETETAAWYDCQCYSHEHTGSISARLTGAPITIKFKGDGLREHVFERWIASTFRQSGNRFRLWGTPHPAGNGRVHVNAIDMHMWQPLFLDISRERCIVMLPKGTCGNTVHRFVTNIQKYLDPGAEAFVGDIEYRALIRRAAESVTYEPTS